jgi:hypothetical protein
VVDNNKQFIDLFVKRLDLVMTHMCFKILVTTIEQSIRICCILIKVTKKDCHLTSWVKGYPLLNWIMVSHKERQHTILEVLYNRKPNRGIQWLRMPKAF